MSYKITKSSEAIAYSPPGHFDMRATGLHKGEDVGGLIALGCSHFLPGGGIDKGAAPVELLYYVLDGEMTAETGNGEKHVLYAGDSIHFSPNQERAMLNTGQNCSRVLIIICPPATNS